MSRVARICAGCNAVVRPGHAPCPNCDTGPARKNDKQTIYVDGPTPAFVDEPSWPRDPTNPHRRLVPNKAAWKERHRKSRDLPKGQRLEDCS